MRVTHSSLKLHPNQDPPPPDGGGDTNPPPPDEQNFTQSDGSPSLLTPSSLSHEGADPTDFIPVSAAGGSRTTPPHEGILRSTIPSPTITMNSFEALASPDSPLPAQTQVYARLMIPASRVQVYARLTIPAPQVPRLPPITAHRRVSWQASTLPGQSRRSSMILLDGFGISYTSVSLRRIRSTKLSMTNNQPCRNP